MTSSRPRTSPPNWREPRLKPPKWWTNCLRTTRRALRSKRMRRPPSANPNQSKICQELKKKTSNLRRGRSSRRCSSQREPSGTPRASGRWSTPRERPCSCKRPFTPTAMTTMRMENQRVTETSESRLRLLVAAKANLLCE